MAGSESGRFSGAERRQVLSGGFDVGEAGRALSFLAGKKLYGSLTVSDGLKDVSFFFTRGGLRVITSGRSLPTLRSRLVARGLMKAKDAKETGRLLRVREGSGAGTGREERDALIEEGKLPAGAVDEATKDIIRDALLSCLFWDEPRHETASGEPDLEMLQRRDLPSITLSLGVRDLIEQVQQELKASAAELRRRFPDLDLRILPTAKGKEAFQRRQPMGEGPGRPLRERLLMLAVKHGRLEGRDAPERVHAGEYELLSRLAELVDDGYLEVERVRPPASAQQARAEAMERSLEQSLNLLLRRTRLAKAWAALADARRAALHMARAGALLMSQGRPREAVERYAAAADLAPDDPEALEGYVQSLWATGQSDQAATQALTLARRYLELKLPARARKALERTLAHKESSEALDLLMQALLKQRRVKQALEVGQRLVERLRREGRAQEAREVAARLLSLGDDSAKREIMKAAGVDRRKVAAMVAVGALIGGLMLPARAQAQAREQYHVAVRHIQDELGRPRPLHEVGPVLGGLSDRLKALALQVEEDPLTTRAVPDKARAVAEQLDAIRTDCQNGAELLELLPWTESPDVDLVLARVGKIRPRSQAFAAPVHKLIEEIGAYRDTAEAQGAKLSLMGPTAEALELAVRMKEEFAGLPQLLAQTDLKVLVQTEPPGASVRYDDVDYSSTTPLELRLPLRGTRDLELRLMDHEPLRRTLALEDLEGSPVVRYALQQVGQATGDPRRRPPPSEPPPRRPRRGGISSASTGEGEGAATPEAQAQVELLDGYVLGDRAADLSFEPSPDLLRDVKLEPRFRARVFMINAVDGSKVFLTGARIVLYVRGHAGWKQERPLSIELDERRERPVVAYPGGKRVVQRLARTLHLDQDALREQIKDGLARAMRAVVDRERSRR